MAMTTCSTKWGSDWIKVRADFAEASCPVEGTNGRQVADFAHYPRRAMRYALEAAARAEGLDPDDEATADMIEDAMAGMDEEVEDDLLFPGVPRERVDAAAAACGSVPDEDDEDWDAESAADARRLTEAIPWSWDFSSWSHAAHLLELEAARMPGGVRPESD